MGKVQQANQTGRFIGTAGWTERAEMLFKGYWGVWCRNREPIPWSVPAVLTVTGGGRPRGATTFNFNGQSINQVTMTVQGGTKEDVDTALSHEVMHAVLASRFGRPLPRWYDEGIAVTAESQIQQTNYDQGLRHYLTTGRGIAFSLMVHDMTYKADQLPTYSQGHSVIQWMMDQKDQTTLLAAQDHAFQHGWPDAFKTYYGQDNLQQAQDTWLSWYRQKISPKPLTLTARVPPSAAVLTETKPDAPILPAMVPLVGYPPQKSAQDQLAQCEPYFPRPRVIVQQGPPGTPGTNGTNGVDGQDGEDGTNGTNGTNGADGISVEVVNINADGDLIITLTDGSVHNAGHVVGSNGADATVDDTVDGVINTVGFYFRTVNIEGKQVTPPRWMPLTFHGDPPTSDNTLTMKQTLVSDIEKLRSEADANRDPRRRTAATK